MGLRGSVSIEDLLLLLILLVAAAEVKERWKRRRIARRGERET